MIPSTVHRWLADGFIAGGQVTPREPFRIRMANELRAQFTEKKLKGYLPIGEATKILGVKRQTVLKGVKHGEFSAVHARCGETKRFK